MIEDEDNKEDGKETVTNSKEETSKKRVQCKEKKEAV